MISLYIQLGIEYLWFYNLVVTQLLKRRVDKSFHPSPFHTTYAGIPYSRSSTNSLPHYLDKLQLQRVPETGDRKATASLHSPLH